MHKRNEITDPVAKAAKENEYPVGRYGGADDIGHAVRFLCSVRTLSANSKRSQPAHNLTVVLSWQEEASFITGVHLPVDGGLTIQLQDDFARKVLDHHAAASKL